MSLQQFANSRVGVSLGLGLGRLLPPKIGYWLSAHLASLITRQRSNPMVQAVRANQWVVRGEQLTSEELTAAARQVFQHAGHCFVDLYHNLKARERINRLLIDTAATRDLIARSVGGGDGAFVVAPHMSNFDLAIMGLAQRGLQAQLLTYGETNNGYQIQNRIRASTGLDITPVSQEAHHQAIKRMRSGGLVATGVDRPIPGKKRLLQFFDHPSPLPAGHIRMALAAQVPVIVISTCMQPDGRYELRVSEPIPMETYPDQQKTVRENAEVVLSVIADHIRTAPEQWLMYYPVWPGVEV